MEIIVVHRLSSTVHPLPFQVHRPTFVIHRPSFVIHRSSFVIHRLSSVERSAAAASTQGKSNPGRSTLRVQVCNPCARESCHGHSRDAALRHRCVHSVRDSPRPCGVVCYALWLSGSQARCSILATTVTTMAAIATGRGTFCHASSASISYSFPLHLAERASIVLLWWTPLRVSNCE